MNKQELKEIFSENNLKKYPLGWDEGLLFIAEYVDEPDVTAWVNDIVEEFYKLWK